MPKVSLMRLERDFDEAIQRLLDGKPTNVKNKADLKAGELEINFSSVAREAKRSRTLIALESTRLPRIRQRVIEHQQPAVSRNSVKGVNISLRERVAELQVLFRNAERDAADHSLARRRAEKEAKRWKEAYDRIAAKDPQRQNKVVKLPGVE
jgi:hypothetical protein